jgi:signal transduction histidine kinase
MTAVGDTREFNRFLVSYHHQKPVSVIKVAEFQQPISGQINAFVDWFIPPKMKASTDVLQGVRMFLFSHLFGPFLGHTISISMLVLEGHADRPWWIFASAVTLFWPFTFALRLTGWYVPLALVSIQNLIFCILWGSYFYGGVSSPIMPWLITVPLLSFFYLPTPRTRITVGLMIAANLSAFYLIYTWFGFPATVPLNSLVGLGLVSTACAGVYVSMMALYYRNIVSSQFELEQEIERHLKTAEELRGATEQVERATRAKSDFLAGMSHELRNPLNAIIGYSELLVECSSGMAEQKVQDLMSIKYAGQKLLTLVNDLLELSRLEAGKIEFAPEQIELSEFAVEMAAKWEPTIVENDNRFEVNCAAEIGHIWCDRNKLERAVDNLMSNAAKFTRHGWIALTLTKEDGYGIIAIKDAGVGMRPEQIETLFETFGSRENETASSYGQDLGLGLPLTQRLCRSMGGELIVESKAGRGSCFMIRIPLQAAMAAVPADDQAKLVVNG